MMIRTAINRFCTQLAADGRSALTIRVYRSELERMGRNLGTRVPITRVRASILAAYLASNACRLTPDGKPRSQRTLNRTRCVLRALFTFLHETRAIRENPARLLRNARVDPPLPVALSDREVKQFLHALDVEARESDIGRRDRVLFTLLLKSGMRLAATSRAMGVTTGSICCAWPSCLLAAWICCCLVSSPIAWTSLAGSSSKPPAEPALLRMSP